MNAQMELEYGRRKIRTARLILRPLTIQDLADCHALRQEEEVMKWQPQGRPDESLTETAEWLVRRMTQNDSLTYGIELQDTTTGTQSRRRVIGLVASHALDTLPTCGIFLAPKFWGRGLATEALTAWLADWEREKLRRRSAPNNSNDHDQQKTTIEPAPTTSTTMWAFLNTENHRSKGLLRSCNFNYYAREDKMEAGRSICVESWVWRGTRQQDEQPCLQP